jgi:hypothetical protein
MYFKTKPLGPNEWAVRLGSRSTVGPRRLKPIHVVRLKRSGDYVIDELARRKITPAEERIILDIVRCCAT